MSANQANDAQGASEGSGAGAQVVLNVYSQGGSLLSSLPLNDGSYLIGRNEDCNLRCDGVPNISRHHAELSVKGRELFIRDLNSKAGTMVNSTVVKDAQVFSGDVIQIGPMKFIPEIPNALGPQERKGEAIVIPSAKESAAEDFDKELQTLAAKCAGIRAEVAKVIVGQKETVEGVLVALLCQGHCLLLGVPGLAKTVMVCAFSKALGLATQRIQFTPDLMPSDILGSEVLKKGSDGMPELNFNQGPIFTQLLLADEINRTPPKTQAALLEAMQERQVTVAMKSYQLPLPFCVIATQNPIEQEGTYPLPEAQQDRFMLCLRLDYPSHEDEVAIIARTTAKESAECRRVVDQNDIIRFQRTVQCVGVPMEQVEYAVRLARATRPGSAEAKAAKVSDFIDWGVGPRAGQALIRGAKALAALDGRPAISKQDVAKLVLPVLIHRISCNYKARAEGLDEAEVIRRILEKVNADKA